MGKKKGIGYWFFIFGVMLLLLRPYFVYRMVAADAGKINPARAWSLMQRLVKKKDDHHEEPCCATSVALTEKTSRLPERRLQAALSIFVQSLWRPVITITQRLSAFYPSQRQRYKLVSCLLI